MVYTVKFILIRPFREENSCAVAVNAVAIVQRWQSEKCQFVSSISGVIVPSILILRRDIYNWSLYKSNLIDVRCTHARNSF